MSVFNRLPRSIVAVCLLLIMAGCQKEKSAESGAGLSTATFSLVASGTDCSDAQVVGTYVINTAVTTTEFMMVTVDVTQTGSWSYNTGVVKGFSFSGTGTFTTTGQQAIMLKASGKPTEGGDIAFPLNLGGGACGFIVTVTDGNAIGDVYYKATISGVDYYQAVTATNKYEAGSSLGGSDDVSVGASINYSTDPLPKGLTTFGVEKGLMHGYLASTEAQFKTYFSPVNYPCAPPGPVNYQNGDGVIIGWTDKDGNNWSSLHATSAQPASSSFKIISVDEIHDATGTYYLKVKMQFNCVLYKEGTNTLISLTNGEMVGYFGKI
jgi:hypothetical protein